MTQTTYNAAEAESLLRGLSQRELYELCQEAYKELDYCMDRWAPDIAALAAYTINELVSCWLSIYQWDMVDQAWTWGETVRQRLEAE